MKLKNFLLFSAVFIILLSNIMGLSFAHPGHGSEYPEEVSSTTPPSTQAHTTQKSEAKTSSQSYSTQKASSQKSSYSNNQKAVSKNKANSQSSNPKSINSQPNTQQSNENMESDLENNSQTNESMEVEEVLSSNSSSNRNQNIFSINNILMAIGAFVIGFGCVISVGKFRR